MVGPISSAIIAPTVLEPVVEILRPSAWELGERLADQLFPERKSPGVLALPQTVQEDPRYKQAMMAYAARTLQLREQQMLAQQEYSQRELQLGVNIARLL